MSNKLTEQQIADLRRQLKDRYYVMREEIRQELLDSDNEQFIDLAGRVHDLEEQSVADFLVDLKLASIDRHIEEIRNIDAALIRIAEASYGTCKDCDAAIPVERLKAYPTAMRCLACQDRYEKLPLQAARPSL